MLFRSWRRSAALSTGFDGRSGARREGTRRTRRRCACSRIGLPWLGRRGLEQPHNRADVGLIGEQVVDACSTVARSNPIEAIAFRALALLRPLPAIIIIIARFGGSLALGVGMMILIIMSTFMQAFTAEISAIKLR